EIFAEVHMLSHLVGAANRADIRRLRQLEAETADLETRLAHEQQRLQEAIASRDQTIRDLEYSIEQMPEAAPERECSSADPALVADLRLRLARGDAHRERVEQQLEEARRAFQAEQEARHAVERREAALCEEIEAIEASLTAAPDDAAAEPPACYGLTVLYVGGRQPLIGHLRR